MPDVQALLQASRAVPTPVGTVVGWSFDVLHWGARCAEPGQPRIAVSQSFIGAREEPAPDEVPLLDGHRRLPTFRQRLGMIAHAIRSYQRFEVTLIRYAELAERLAERVAPREQDGGA